MYDPKNGWNQASPYERSAAARAARRAQRKNTQPMPPPIIDSNLPAPPSIASEPADGAASDELDSDGPSSVRDRQLAGNNLLFKRNKMERMYEAPAEDEYSGYRQWLDGLLQPRDDIDCDDDDHCIIR